MAKLHAFVLASLVLTLAHVTSKGQTSDGPETVVVHNGPVTLHAMLWRPHGSGPFPTIQHNPGSGSPREQLHRLGPYAHNVETLRPVFYRRGYVFHYMFRHGVGTYSDQGDNASDLMNKESAEH